MKHIENKIKLITEEIQNVEKQENETLFLNEMKKIGIDKLPYSYSALKQFIDAETMNYHYNKHYKGYVDKLNAALKNKDYAAKKSEQIVTITAARIKPVLNLEKIAVQDVKEFPTIISIPRVYSPTDGWALPTSLTPTVCVGAGFYARLVSGGECKLSYQTSESRSFQASDLYIQTFEILKDGKSVVVPTPVATPTPTATPTPVATAVPVVKKTITCVKGKKSVKKTAISPKCPAGYKVKK